MAEGLGRSGSANNSLALAGEQVLKRHHISRSSHHGHFSSFGIVHVWFNEKSKETIALKKCRFGPEVLLSDKVGMMIELNKT